MQDKTKGILGALGNAFTIGLAFLFVKLALGIGNPLDVLAHRFTIAFLVIVIIALFKKEPLILSKKDFLNILPLGILFPVFFFTFQVFGLNLTTTAEAGLIQATIPIFTLILASIFLKEKATLDQKIFTIISVLGVMLIVLAPGIDPSQGFKGQFLGIFLVTMSCLSSAVYNIVTRKKTQSVSLFKISYMMSLMGFICFNLFSLVQHLMYPTMGSYFAPLANPSYLISIVYTGLVAFLFSAYCSNYALSKLPAGEASVIGNVSIVITILAGVIILNEPFNLIHIIATILILVGVAGANRTKKTPTISS